MWGGVLVHPVEEKKPQRSYFSVVMHIIFTPQQPRRGEPDVCAFDSLRVAGARNAGPAAPGR